MTAKTAAQQIAECEADVYKAGRDARVGKKLARALKIDLSARTPQVITTRTIGYRPNPPRNWREGHDGSLACPHRDVSVCPDCEKANPEACDGRGAHFWITLDQRSDPLFTAVP